LSALENAFFGKTLLDLENVFLMFKKKRSCPSQQSHTLSMTLLENFFFFLLLLNSILKQVSFASKLGLFYLPVAARSTGLGYIK